MGKSKPAWVHMPDDGRGARLVFVGGILQERVLRADERRGFALVARKENPRVHDVVHGHVTVIPHP